MNAAWLVSPVLARDREQIMKQAIIDRFEGGYAVIEHDGNTFDFPRALLPEEAKEGDVLVFSVSIDATGTEDRKDTIRKLEDDLFQ